MKIFKNLFDDSAYKFERDESGELPTDLIIKIAVGAYKNVRRKTFYFPRDYSPEDMLQDAICQALSIKYDKSRPKVVSMGYIYKSVYNGTLSNIEDHCGTLVKCRGKSCHLPDKIANQICDRELPLERELHMKEVRKAVRYLISREPVPMNRTVIREYYFKEKSISEIAREYGVSPARIGQRLQAFYKRSLKNIMNSRKLKTLALET